MGKKHAHLSQTIAKISMVQVKFILNHYLSGIFDCWCGINIHPLRPG